MNDDQLRALLQSRDPAASLPQAAPERVARLLEDAMSHDLDTPAQGPATPEVDPRRRTPLTWLLAAAAILVIAGVGAFGFFGAEDEPTAQPPETTVPKVLELSVPAPTQGRCRMVTADALAGQQSAFDGTVTSIRGTTVTLDVGRWYRGGDAPMVKVVGPSDRLAALIQAVSFENGQRYLVTANEGVVTVCGFSAPYSDDLAALYSEAFGT